MQKVIRFSIVALIVALTACSHGGNGTLPASRNVQTNDSAIQHKVANETKRETSTFVASKHPGFIAETPSAPLTWQTGIKQGGEAPVPGGMFTIVNQYDTMENGQYVTVYAGSLNTTGEGVVLIVKRSADLHTATAQTYAVAPTAVRIESTSNGQLQLQTLRTGAVQSIRFRVPM